MAFNINMGTAITESVLFEDKLNISLFFSFSSVWKIVRFVIKMFR
jgi:hypothetical protein